MNKIILGVIATVISISVTSPPPSQCKATDEANAALKAQENVIANQAVNINKFNDMTQASMDTLKKTIDMMSKSCGK